MVLKAGCSDFQCRS